MSAQKRLQKPFLPRLFVKFFIDTAFSAASAWGAYALRLGLPLPVLYHRSVFVYILFSTLLKGILAFFARFANQSWRNIGVRDLLQLGQTSALFCLLASSMAFLSGDYYRIPRSIPLIDAMLSLLCWGGARLAIRLFLEGHIRSRSKGQNKRVLVVGAGDAGTMIVREMLRHPEAELVPIGFLDDDPAKKGETFLGLPVFGGIKTLSSTAKKCAVDEILIAIPSALGSVIRSVLEEASAVNVPARIIPGIWEVLSGKVSISSIRDVEVEDLLNRAPVYLDLDEIAGYLSNRTVLVTGAGGSIGSEIVRQILPFRPKHLVLLGRGENSLFQLEQELTSSFHFHYPFFSVIVGDVRNKDRMMRVFERFRPQVVFHAASHKHVPLMEDNPEEAILNNVFGAVNLTELALAYSTKVFVNISTDKAVNPTSVMGASKRVAEMVVRTAAAKTDEGNSFVSVRFGNVLGSRGSVIPTFKEQIRRGGPITITHPDMTRYFMTIPEAAQLVLQAGGMKRNGSVFVLDMGEPVKIVDLAEDLIRLSGFVPGEDIEIVFSGVRPGEKLFEELLTTEEGTESSRFQKIFMAKSNNIPGNFSELLEELRAAAQEENSSEIRRILKKMIPMCRVDQGKISSERA